MALKFIQHVTKENLLLQENLPELRWTRFRSMWSQNNQKEACWCSAVIIQQYQNTKIVLQRATLQFGLRKSFWLKNDHELNEHYGGKVKVELDLSNYVTKVSLKRSTGIGTSMLASKTDLASLETKFNNSDINKFKTVSAALSKRREM